MAQPKAEAGLHECLHEVDWSVVKNDLSSISKHFKDNGELSMPSKVKLLWEDRTSRKRFIEGTSTWAFRGIVLWLLTHKG